MLVNLSEVMTVKGQTRHTDVSIELEHFIMYGDVYDFASKGTASVDVTCVAEHKVSISCKADVMLQIPCSRCLKDVQVPFAIDFEREFDFSGMNEERNEELKEAEYILDHDLDVDALISEEMMLQFPMQTLCKDDCKGFCDICGVNLNLESCNCSEQGRDPRMLAIQDIFKNFGQTDN